jgi:quercetin dioxygenase-like cupin family protein
MEKAPRHTGSLVGNGIAPEPIRDRDGAPILGPQNVPAERANPDLLTPPQTDSGTVPNLKFSFADAHNRLLSGGWAREVTIRELPIATELAGVNMRLKPGGVREMHWHKEAEWAYMLAGRARITAVDQEGRNFIDDVGEGDIWNFPAGIPHSIQGPAGWMRVPARLRRRRFLGERDVPDNRLVQTHPARRTGQELRPAQVGVRRPAGGHRTRALHLPGADPWCDRFGRGALARGRCAPDLQPPPNGPGAG